MVDFLTIVIAILGLIPVYGGLYLKFKDRKKIKLFVERFYEPTKTPVDSDWGIRIRNPNKPIEKCSVLYNGELIPWWDKAKPYYEKRFVEMGGGNVRIPKAIQNEDAEIKIQNNKKTIETVKFKDLITSH